MDFLKFLSSGSSSVSSSGNWGSSERASSLYSHQQSRNFAKLAVDSVNLAATVRTGRPTDCGTLKGIRSDNVKAELGDDEFDNLCADGGLALVTICYCQRGLEHLKERFSKDKLAKDSGKPVVSDADVQEIEKMKARAVINHDYLVLELQPGDPKNKKFYITAEKLAVGGAQGKPGIYITHRKSEECFLLLNEKTKLYAINCGQSLHVPLQAILKILKEANPDYSLRNANCWDYATTTAKKLALKCAEVAGISATERDRLTRESKDFEATLNKNNMKNIASTVMEWSSARISS